ncbi:MAG: hypothetical protein V2A56_13830 [bacterium]
MKAFEIRIVVTGVLFLLSALSGTIVRLFGRPLNTPVFTVHKLLALSFAVFVVLLVHLLLKSFEGGPWMITLIVLSGVLLLMLLVSGGVLSFDKLASDGLKVIHRVTPLILAFSLVVMIYFQLRARG